jgi:hypothetical protein
MNSSNTKLKIGLIAGVVIALGAIVAIFKGGTVPNSSITTLPIVDNSNTAPIVQTNTGDNSQNTPTPPTTPPVATTSTYKDGTYSADGNYNSPAGPESISVTLTLKNDIVTGANVTANASYGRSAQYQNAFISGYKQYVIGKNISSLNLGRVSGSSLTPIGFNNALAQIKAQAKA